MSLKAMEKVCWEATCDNCGEGDNVEYGGSFHYPSREEALETVESALEWVERDGILLCNSCIENDEDYSSEDVEKAVASLIEKVRAERADGSPEHSPHITTAHRVYERSSGEIMVDPPVDGPHVFINRLRYGNLSEPMSGRALRLLPNPPIPEDDDLWEETAVGADGDRLVGRDDILKVGNGERFYTSPSSITAGSPEHSSCCGAGVRVDSGDEGTSCYVCERCGKPCDARRGSSERGGEGE